MRAPARFPAVAARRIVHGITHLGFRSVNPKNTIVLFKKLATETKIGYQTLSELPCAFAPKTAFRGKQKQARPETRVVKAVDVRDVQPNVETDDAFHREKDLLELKNPAVNSVDSSSVWNMLIV